jgi:type I restriction enzyme S subunit
MKWHKLTFKTFITLQRGFDLPVTEMKDGEVPVLGSTGVIGYHNKAKVNPPGVVTGRSGTIGVIQYTDKPYWPHNTSLWVKDFKLNHPKFVYYKMHTLKLDRFNGGASVPTLNRNNLDNLKVQIPDTLAQEKIADILSAYDDLIDTNRRRIQLLEESARLLFREWFVFFRFPRLRQGFGGQAGHQKACPVESRNSTGVKIEDGLPEGWASQPIATISDCVGGGTPSTSMPAYWVDGDITWVTPTDVTRNKHFILLDSEKKITEAGLQNSSAKLVPAHTVLMTSRASVGFFAIANREVCTNQGFISIVPHDAVFSLFLLFQLSERVEEIRAMGSGSTYPEVSRGKFRDFKVIIPPKKLVSDFDEQASFCFKQISNLKQQNQKLAQARDLLLPRLMSGAIDPVRYDKLSNGVEV